MSRDRLSPDAFDALCASHRDGFSLPQAFYGDPRVHALDLERLWRRRWLFAGHASRIAQPGDYTLFKLGDDELILTRNAQGEARALFNTCTHRGSALCLEPCGHAAKFVCPYHQWVFDADGELRSARNMPDDFDKASFGLRRAHIRELESLLFVCFAEEPPDFEPFANAMRPHLKLHGLPRAKVAATRAYELRANWKLMAENFFECNHCPTGHPEYCKAMAGITPPPRVEDREAERAHVETQRAWVARRGLAQQLSFEAGGWFHLNHMPLRPGFVTQSLDGKPVAPLMGEHTAYEAPAFAIVAYPNFWFEAGPDVAVTLRTLPRGPQELSVEAEWLVHADAVEGRDYDLERVMGLWKATGEQDWALIENNQRGVNSSRYRPGPYSPASEGGCRRFVAWYLDQLRKA